MFWRWDVYVTFVEFPFLSYSLTAAGWVLVIGRWLVNPGGCKEGEKQQETGD